MPHYFITGTDTDVGKTYVTCLLLEALRREGKRAVGYKPVASGDRADAVALLSASAEETLTLDDVNPTWFKTPAAPYVAALMENRPVDVQALLDGFVALTARFDQVLVEGAGGWEVPLTESLTMGDLATRLGLPVLLVVNNKLGAINHTLLTLAAIKARGLECAGIILNHVADERHPASISNRAVLEHFTEVPIVLEIMHGETEVDWPLVCGAQGLGHSQM
jgi:dethiobiotin synthetase